MSIVPQQIVNPRSQMTIAGPVRGRDVAEAKKQDEYERVCGENVEAPQAASPQPQALDG